MQQDTLLRRVLRRLSKLRSLEKGLTGLVSWSGVLRRVLRRGSEKGLSRRHLEGRNTPVQRV